MKPRFTLQIIKLKSFRLLIFYILLSVPMFGQNDKTIDSLLNILKTVKEDTNKVYILIELGKSFGREKNHEALKSFEDALKLAINLNDKKAMAISYFRVGNANYWRLGNFSEALKNYIESLKIWEELGDRREIAGLNHNIGLAYSSASKYAEGIKYLTLARKKYEENGQLGHVADVYNTTGSFYKTLGNYPEALKNYFGAIEIGEGGWGAAAYNNAGVIYRLMGNYSEALKYHFKSLKIREEEKNKEGLAFVYLNIGNVYSDQGNYSDALRNHLIAFKYFEEAKSRPARFAGAHAEIAAVYTRQGNFQEALKNYQTSLEINDSKTIPLTIDCNIGIGNIYIKLNKFSDARKHLSKALSLSKDIGSIERIRNACESLSKLDSALGNYQQALVYYKLYKDYNDSLFSEINSQQVALMKVQFESEKKDKEILQLTSDKQISTLVLKAKSDSLMLAQVENDKIRIENEKAEALNLFNEQQIEFLSNEKKLQQLQIEKTNADYAVLNRESNIRQLQLNKQKQTKNYLLASIALLIIFSFFLYWNYRTRQRLKLQTLRNKIASDLHDDIGSTLSSISIFSQMAQAQSKEAIPLLETIGESSRRMLDAMADIVWTIKPENDQFEKIILRMRSFAYELLGAKKIDFEFEADEEVEKMKLPMEVRKNLFLIFKEATNNMVKYAQANKAMFAIRGEKNNLTMMIRDNGKGFEVKSSSEGNGLKNMRKRANEIGGQLTIDSSPGHGTLIELKIAV